ncbi:response regulator [Flavisolibacter nicotianae]|uniref:response regulator n=1 Tax=Flavisolibacter nicotianae TaxID=2364882 RepID=UPI000EACE266|nr:response regulator [Flavisolibacter nicotianae]
MKSKDIDILMVDDDEEDRLLLKDTFEELGYGDCVQYEENGERALAYLQQCTKEGATLPCLMILDLNMPKLNGRQTLKLLKAEPSLQHIAVVIYSTSLNPVERDECLALGAHSYVVKPISYKESVDIANKFFALCKSLKAIAAK